MDLSAFSARFAALFAQNGLAHLINEENVDRFFRLFTFLCEENEKYNLTAILAPDEVIVKHFADCAHLCALLPEGAHVLDVGCGGGFPSLPIALLRPDIRLVSLDSTAKKLRFVSDAAALLGCANLSTLCARAEEAGQDPLRRERFDAVVARAVARLPVLCELCLPFVKVGGQFFAMKGAEGAAEAAEGQRAISLLGGRLLSDVAFSLSLDDVRQERHILCIRKQAPTPGKYPRPFAKIKKLPL